MVHLCERYQNGAPNSTIFLKVVATIKLILSVEFQKIRVSSIQVIGESVFHNILTLCGGGTRRSGPIWPIFELSLR